MKPEISEIWEDGGNAGVIITCCNIQHDTSVEAGEVWVCPECGQRVKFKWVGMTHEVLEPILVEVKQR